MRTDRAAPSKVRARRGRGAALVLSAIAASVLFSFLAPVYPWIDSYPDELIVPVAGGLTHFINWLVKDADFGLFTFKELTRGFGAFLDAPVHFLKSAMATGFSFGGSGGSTHYVPPLSWLGMILVFTAIGASVGGRRLAGLIAFSFLYVAFFGLWESTMMTFASIIVAVVLGIATGVVLGVLTHRWLAFERMLTPVFDFMQTMPVFAYLVPALMLFGYGPAGALVVTLIYAMPPMARVTSVALDQVSQDIVEFGRMAGCSRRQLMWNVMLPAIRPRLMVGVNQVIMLTLNMVIIASMIGAGGLGFDVWQSLKALRIGQGAEAGIAITLVAIVLDRVSQQFAARRPIHRTKQRGFFAEHRILVGAAVLAIATTFAGIWIPALTQVPESWTMTTGRFWDTIIDWININLYGYIGAARDTFFIYLLKPFKNFMLSLPWLGVVLLVAVIGFHLGGVRLAVFSASLIAFIAAVGLWDKAMVSAYLVGVCVLLASLVGIPIGIAAARNDRLHHVVQIVIDTLQTLPAFVYLIPVIMLFSVGDFSAMIAVVLYALVPAIRYTDSGIRQVPSGLVEAARAMGCTRAQVLRQVQLPLAMPDIMLGVNQTLMMGLSMLVITALVGTRDLGQETLIALSKVDPGRGVIAGACVALIAIVTDRLIGAWAKRRKRELGIDFGTAG